MTRNAARHRVADATPVLDTLALHKTDIARAAAVTGALAVVPVMLATPAMAQAPAGAAPRPASSPALTGDTVTVRSGDTVSVLARRAGVSTSAMLAANGLGARTLIFPGQTLVIPGRAQPVATPAEEASDIVQREQAAPAASRAEGVLALARQQIGIDYAYGEETPSRGFDCSGLIQYVYGKAAGVATPRTTGQLRTFGTRVPAAEARPGDLVLFDDYAHAAIYVGNGKIIDAPRTGSEVSERKLWTDEVVFRRVL